MKLGCDIARMRATEESTGEQWFLTPFSIPAPLVISIETRKEVGEDYSALRGFFRQFELYYENRNGVRNRFPGAWRGAGASGCFGLSRVCGSTNEREQTDPRTR